MAASIIGMGASGTGGMMNSVANSEAQIAQSDQNQQNSYQYLGLAQNQQVANNLSQTYAHAQNNENYQNAHDSVTQYGEQSAGALNAGFGGAQQHLGTGYGQAQNALGSGMSGAQNQLQPLTQTAGLAQQVGNMQLGAGYQQSPGYQFQLQQGQQAIAQQQAASGGRDSGAAQKALLQYSQGLANQDYQQFVGNQLAQGNQQLSAAQMGYGAASQLGGMYNQNGQASAGLYAQGANQMADMSAANGQALSGVYGQMGQSNANLYGQQSQLESNMSAQYAGMNSGLTQSTIQPIMGQTYAPDSSVSTPALLGGFFAGIGGSASGYAAGGGK